MKQFVFVIATLCSTMLSAQSDTLKQVYILPYAEIEPDPLVLSAGFEVQVDSTLLDFLPSLSIGEALEFTGVSGFRTYGPKGSLISPLNKGLSSDHTLVTWDGIPLNTPSLGSADLSKIPAALFNSVQFRTDQFNSSNIGGGAAGNIDLSDQWVDGTLINGAFNAIQNASALAKSGYRFNERWRGSTAFTIVDARNEFDYVDPFMPVAANDQPETRSQGNNNFHQISFKQRVEYGEKDQPWSGFAGVWAQQSRLNIPSNFGALNHLSGIQRDSSLRFSGGLNYNKPNHSFSLRVGHFLDYQEYIAGVSESASIPSSINNRRNFVSLDLRKYWGDWRYGVTLSADDQQATGDNYANGKANQLLMGARGYVVYTHRVYYIEADGRVDLIDDNTAVNGDVRIGIKKARYDLSISAQRVFRYPDLNERFWISGGNENLNPEQGWSYNLSASTTNSWGRHQVKAQLNGYMTDMASVIVWVPGDQFWEPRNIDTVSTVGVTASIDYSVRLGEGKLISRTRLNIQEDDNQEETFEPFYPAIQFNEWMEFRWKRFNLGANARFVSNQWEYEALNASQGTQDATAILDAFAGVRLGDMSAPIKLNLFVRNLRNTLDYRISRTPSPGRVVSLSVSWNIKHQSK